MRGLVGESWSARSLKSEFRYITAPSHPDAALLLEYWRERMAADGFLVGRDVPSRSLGKMLSNLALFEPLADGTDMRARLAGMSVRKRFDGDITGRLLSELFPPEEFVRHLEATRNALADAQPVIVDSKLMRRNIVERHLEVVGLPVTAPDRVTTWILVGYFRFG